MKAYLEFDMPESCETCELKCHDEECYFCGYTGNQIDKHVTGKFNNERHENCPLNEVEANQAEIERLEKMHLDKYDRDMSSMCEQLNAKDAEIAKLQEQLGKAREALKISNEYKCGFCWGLNDSHAEGCPVGEALSAIG
jgi:hypothetical protein